MKTIIELFNETVNKHPRKINFYACPRRSGKTSSIIELASKDDMIVTFSLSMKQSIEEQLSKIPTPRIISKENIDNERGRQLPKKIFVDEIYTISTSKEFGQVPILNKELFDYFPNTDIFIFFTPFHTKSAFIDKFITPLASTNDVSLINLSIELQPMCTYKELYGCYNTLPAHLYKTEILGQFLDEKDIS